MRPKYTRWQQFRRQLAHQFDCPASRERWGQSELTCDLNWGHQGFHVHGDGWGYWVWSSNGFVSGYIEMRPPAA